MRKSILAFTFGLTVCFLLWAQQDRPLLHAPYEVKSLFPQEFSPGEFRQVDQRELSLLAEQGWELVSVMPYIYRNEERGDSSKLRPIVTQTYPAYFFKRPKIMPKN